MKIRIAIEQEYDLSDDNIFDDEYELDLEDVSMDTKVDYLVNRFAEDIDSMVKYDEVGSAILVEYIEE